MVIIKPPKTYFLCDEIAAFFCGQSFFSQFFLLKLEMSKVAKKKKSIIMYHV